MLRSLVLLAALLIAVPAQALTPHTVVTSIVQSARAGERGLFEGLGDLSQLPTIARITMFAGADATVSLIELGDKSPLKKAVGEQVWGQLVIQAPRLAQAALAMREALVQEVLAALEKHDLELPRTASFVAGGMVLAAGKVEDLLQKATLIYSARAVLALARDGRVTRKLAFMAIDPRVPAQVRKEAGIALAISTGVELQQTIAEVNLLKQLEGN